ncbi:MAG: hypothetical protein ACW9W3_05710 [Candidatus Nitrosopumilus sp. bin_68KS]
MQTSTHYKSRQKYSTTPVRTNSKYSHQTRVEEKLDDVYGFSGIINDSIKKYSHQTRRRCI